MSLLRVGLRMIVCCLCVGCCVSAAGCGTDLISFWVWFGVYFGFIVYGLFRWGVLDVGRGLMLRLFVGFGGFVGLECDNGLV